MIAQQLLSLLWVASMQALHRSALARDVRKYNELAHMVLPICVVLDWPEWGPAMRGWEEPS